MYNPSNKGNAYTKFANLIITKELKLKIVKRPLKNQKGQGVMEYIILTGLIGIICLGAVKKFGKSLDTRLNQIDRKIKNELVIK